jgi:hypothetical protein
MFAGLRVDEILKGETQNDTSTFATKIPKTRETYRY